jgi:Cu(I)/Ag(I) efflux system membrane fusion protein
MTEPVPARKLPSWLGTAVFLAALVAAGVVFRSELRTWFADRVPSPAEVAIKGAATASYYTCPMHPSVKQGGPGKCPICGMDLVPVAKESAEGGVVTIDAARRQLIGVRIGSVIEAPLRRSFRAVGRVTYDESNLTDVTLKVRGFITKLYASRTGQRVEKGQPLFELFSSELFSAEQDFLLAAGGSELLARAARQRLHLLGLGDSEIDALQRNGAASESIKFPSPASGFVIEKDVVEGGAVEAGMRLFRIAKLDRVWVEADVYEADLAHVRVGQAATVALDYLPDRAYDAKISYVYPFLEPSSRTGRVRLELANKALELRPGMFASVTLASSAEPRLQVPASAVVYTGPRRLVFVDLGEGRFRPQEVQVGTEADGMDEVLSGLTAGDRVATSGVFLIAAEARISTAAKYWDDRSDEADAGAPK